MTLDVGGPAGESRAYSFAFRGNTRNLHAMLHYHVWFNLKPGIAEREGLAAVSNFLATLRAAGEVTGFQLMQNAGQPPRSKLPRYHAWVEFADGAALDAAMKQQAQRGVHAGAHGQVTDVVCDFHVELFTSVATAVEAEVLQACEI